MKIVIPYRAYNKDRSLWLNFIVAIHILIMIIAIGTLNVYTAIITLCSLLILSMAWIGDFFPKGYLKLIINNKHLYINVNGADLKVKSYYFFWSNIFTVIGNGNTALRNDQTHIINIQLNVFFQLENGKTVIIKNRLFQWQSAPVNWKYKHFDPNDYDSIHVTHYDLRKLKRQIRTHRN